MCVVVFTMSAITSNAVEKDASNENQKSVYSNSIIYLTQDDISNKDIFTEQEIKKFQEKDSQFLRWGYISYIAKKEEQCKNVCDNWSSLG